MATPRKRRSGRGERRADIEGRTATEMIPAPPSQGCPAWHWYWCAGHQAWHHHTAEAEQAIQASLPAPE